jgi:hypothetical protein
VSLVKVSLNLKLEDKPECESTGSTLIKIPVKEIFSEIFNKDLSSNFSPEVVDKA